MDIDDKPAEALAPQLSEAHLHMTDDGRVEVHVSFGQIHIVARDNWHIE